MSAIFVEASPPFPVFGSVGVFGIVVVVEAVVSVVVCALATIANANSGTSASDVTIFFIFMMLVIRAKLVKEQLAIGVGSTQHSKYHSYNEGEVNGFPYESMHSENLSKCMLVLLFKIVLVSALLLQDLLEGGDLLHERVNLGLD